jgi:hypothetical protein
MESPGSQRGFLFFGKTLPGYLSLTAPEGLARDRVQGHIYQHADTMPEMHVNRQIDWSFMGNSQ